MPSEIVLPEWLEVDGESCASRAFQHLDLSALLSERDRTENVPVPYVDGRVPFVGWLDEVDATVTWLVNGKWTPEGSLNSDAVSGVYDNLEFYRAVFRDGADEDGTKPIELHVGSFVLSGTMQCRRWEPVRTGPTTMTVLSRLIVPSGRLAEPGS